MTNNLSAVETKRLAFIKYLYTLGLEQSKLHEPISSTSLLAFHDSVELFLHLASEKLNTGKNKVDFMDYFSMISEKLEGIELYQKESMRRMNKARVALKHHGNFPSFTDIEDFRNSTENFLYQNSKLIFAVDFTEISLIDFIEPQKARDLLKEANHTILNNDKYEAIKNISIAFEVILDHYEEKAADDFGESPFDFGSGFTQRRYETYYQSYTGEGKPDLLVLHSLESISTALKVLALNLDYRKFSKFRRIRIPLDKTGGSYFPVPKVELERIYSKSVDELITKDDLLFCFNFVIDSGLIIHSFYKYI